MAHIRLRCARSSSIERTVSYGSTPANGGYGDSLIPTPSSQLAHPHCLIPGDVRSTFATIFLRPGGHFCCHKRGFSGGGVDGKPRRGTTMTVPSSSTSTVTHTW